MKKMLLAAAAVALFSAPAFAAPEPYNVDVNTSGQFRVSPPSNSEAQAPAMQSANKATWTRAEAPSSPSTARPVMMQTADDQAAPAKPKKHHKKHKAAPATEAPKASNGSGAPAGQGQQ